jgi:uncharacterized protein (DUF2141 family)
MKNLFLIIMTIGFLGTISAQTEKTSEKTETGTLLILVRGFKSTEGQLIIVLYNSAENFLSEKPYKSEIREISANEELIKFENIPYGDYAAAAIHDINNDGKLDKNILGIPTGGYGFSNDAMDKYGPPTFLQASFVFDGRDEVRIIDLQYGIPK